MYERAEMFGGRLKVESQLGTGTTIRLQVET
jgi:signal transduction histidine kinase